MNYKSIVNDNLQREINLSDLNWDVLELSNGGFHIVKANKTYHAKVVEANSFDKTFVLEINKHQYTVQIKDKFDVLVDQLGFSTAATKKINQIKAPMPGLVLDVIVNVGDVVQKGDSVLILEAMKMENVIKAEGEAVVKNISIEKGTAVEKNQILIEFE